MKRSAKAGLVAGAVIAASGAGIGIASAGGEDDAETETAITGEALDKASTAALEHTGGGEVTGTEVDDEESYYEVEVTMPDGQEVDVQLNEDFEVVGSEAEDGHEDEGSSDN